MTTEPIESRVFARAGLLGNPSDGFGGKTISFSIGQFAAEVQLVPADTLEILPAHDGRERYASVAALAQHIKRNGYYGAERLIKAAIRRFTLLAQETGLVPAKEFERGFSLRYSSNIPRAVGLAGSSAIVIATLRALEEFFSVRIAPELLPSLALSAEVEELNIPAGLQDRVIQCYQGMVAMNFDPQVCRNQSGFQTGVYRPLNPPSSVYRQLYVAFGSEAGQPTEVLHNDLRERFNAGDAAVHQAMRQFAEFAAAGIEAIEQEDVVALNALINQNFELRNQLCQLHEMHIKMVRTAQSCGASAKYCGSGGAIVGLCDDDKFVNLCEQLGQLNCQVIRPVWVPPNS